MNGPRSQFDPWERYKTCRVGDRITVNGRPVTVVAIRTNEPAATRFARNNKARWFKVNSNRFLIIRDAEI